ncbi:hypothetical protein BWD09_11500 [Neisseria dentiae]|uniref:DUF306 domain-containing protein n=2 Tax=Neisseria TaxID=482 RepID=A0A1X3D301_9NEIS|nr:hypothetical protein BWD09_11500 [Neisseria dentiae]QMT45367.1 META domain-containing protein [Neisseria dentiae]STZ51139.1 Uncharacterised protein [Neisseria dentiae]
MSAGFTEKACAAPLMRLDDRLAAAVRQTVSYRISGTQLEWLDENGNTVLKARRAENADKQAVAD